MRIIKITLLSFLLAISGTVYSSNHSDKADLKKIINDITKGRKVTNSKVKLTTPVIAENGAVIPIKLSVSSPMTKGNYVKSVHVVITGNPDPKAFSVKLTPAMGTASFSTRIRMGKTSEVRAYAVMNDDRVFVDKKAIKVTIGGCG